MLRLTGRLGGARWLSRRPYISAGHACSALPVRVRGPGGGQACRRAAGWVRRGEGEGGTRTQLGGGAWRLRRMPTRGPHTWVRARQRRPAPCGAVATPARARGLRATLARWRLPPRGGTGAARAAGAPPGQATPHTTRNTPWGSRPALRRLPHTSSGAW